MGSARIRINRAPVLTLWAAVVAERLGYEEETALTLGKAVAVLNAQSKKLFEKVRSGQATQHHPDHDDAHHRLAVAACRSWSLLRRRW